MEVCLVVIAISIIIYDFFPLQTSKILRSFIETFRNNPKKEIRYLGMSVLTSMCIIHAPSLYIIAYMRKLSFYSYEIFSVNHNLAVFAEIKIIFLFLVFFVYQVFWLSALRQKEYVLAPVLFLAAALMVVILFSASKNAGDIGIGFAVLFFSFTLGIYFIVVLVLTPASKVSAWWILLALSICLTLMPFFYSFWPSYLVGMGLRSMNVGDEIVQIQSKESNERDLYCLLLRTNEFLYLRKATESNGKIDVDRTNTIIIDAKSVTLIEFSKMISCAFRK